VTPAFRNLAIVSVQFRPLLTTWTFTVVVPADKISVTTFAGGDAPPGRQREGGLTFFCAKPSIAIENVGAQLRPLL